MDPKFPSCAVIEVGLTRHKTRVVTRGMRGQWKRLKRVGGSDLCLRGVSYESGVGN